jgi:hypothetical protein
MLDGLDDGAKDGCPEGSIVERLAVGDVEGIDDGAIDDPTVGFPVGQKLLGVRLVWFDGQKEGSKVGHLVVGFIIGSMVGSFVGAFDDIAEGSIVGVQDGFTKALL